MIYLMTKFPLCVLRERSEYIIHMEAISISKAQIILSQYDWDSAIETTAECIYIENLLGISLSPNSNKPSIHPPNCAIIVDMETECSPLYFCYASEYNLNYRVSENLIKLVEYLDVEEDEALKLEDWEDINNTMKLVFSFCQFIPNRGNPDQWNALMAFKIKGLLGSFELNNLIKDWNRKYHLKYAVMRDNSDFSTMKIAKILLHNHVEAMEDKETFPNGPEDAVRELINDKELGLKETGKGK